MLFWSLMIAFGVVWAVAVAIEVLWFWGPAEEAGADVEPSPGKSEPMEKTDPSQKGGQFEGGLETRAS